MTAAAAIESPSTVSTQQNDRHARDRQVTNLGACAVVADRSVAAAVPPHDRRQGLDVAATTRHHETTVPHSRLAHPDDRGRVVATVIPG